MNKDRLDGRQARRAFGRAAAVYARHDALARELETRLLDSLDYYEGQPALVVDAGCGGGHGTAALRKRWRHAEVIALDFALPMLHAARHHAGWLRTLPRVCADARRLPLPDRSVDVVYSNLCLPWCGAPKTALKEFARVLKPDGFMVASSLGPDTLMELRAAWAAADPGYPHVDACVDMHDIGDAALAAGLKDPVLDTDHIVTTYADVDGLLAELKGAGTTNADVERRRTLTGKARFAALRSAYTQRTADGRVPATWEVVTLHAWGPPKNFLPRYGGRETPFEVIQWAERRPRR